MHLRCSGVIIVLLFSLPLFSATFTVSKNGTAQFTTIQAAVDAAGEGDEIVIKDMSVYEEQVTIDHTKNGLVLRSENPAASQKPTIIHQDRVNVGPTTCEEANDTNAITFRKNGTLRLLSVKQVRIDGITVDGGGVYPFGFQDIWQCRWPNQYGNSAVVLATAGETVIRNCDIRHAYFGVMIYEQDGQGIYAPRNENPSDPLPPLPPPSTSEFAPGNHLIEYNRIHNNSFGLFFESIYDVGSTVRYNLMYENHHPSAEIAAEVKALTEDGAVQPGGVFAFKDDVLSPMAIHNNTFWHNGFLFVGMWHPGGIHLVFNNIFASPHTYWSNDEHFGEQVWQELAPLMGNRMHHCVFAAQQHETTEDSIMIMEGFNQPDTQGDEVGAPFPAGSNVRYLETPFLSTDESSPDFLVLDWSDQLVQQYILDGGWEDAGVKDPDGSRADLGAVPSGGGRPVDVITIKPTRMMVYSSGVVNLSFKLVSRLGTLENPDVVFLRFVRNLDDVSNFGNEAPSISSSQIQSLAIPAQPVRIGSNEFTMEVRDPGTFAFAELIVGGSGSDQQYVTSSVGFLPYLKTNYFLDVAVWDAGKTTELSEVRAGTPVKLVVSARLANGDPFGNIVDPTGVNLKSQFTLRDLSGNPVTSVPGGISGTVDLDVMFTRIPWPTGTEHVIVAGTWVDETKIVGCVGSSPGIRVLPGTADSIAFQDPPSGMCAVVDPGTHYPVKVQVFDRFGNRVNTLTQVKCVSTLPDIGTILDTIVETDTTGFAIFSAQAVRCELNDTFWLVATLPANGAQDSVCMILGCPRRNAVTSLPTVIRNKYEINCILYDLHGRVVKKVSVFTYTPHKYESFLPNTIGNGIYLMKVINITTGKVQRVRQIRLKGNF